MQLNTMILWNLNMRKDLFQLHMYLKFNFKKVIEPNFPALTLIHLFPPQCFFCRKTSPWFPSPFFYSLIYSSLQFFPLLTTYSEPFFQSSPWTPLAPCLCFPVSVGWAWTSTAFCFMGHRTAEPSQGRSSQQPPWPHTGNLELTVRLTGSDLFRSCL